MCQKDFILDLKIYRHLSESYVLAYLQSKLLFFVGTINSLASTSRHSAIFTNVSNPGCAVLVHHFETVVQSFPRVSASHLFVLLCSTRTTLMRLIMGFSFDSIFIQTRCRVSGGSFTLPSLGTVLDSLPSHGSSYLTLLFIN